VAILKLCPSLVDDPQAGVELLLLYRFFLNHNLHVSGYVFVQLYGDGKIANRL
jgi:hypothetical protein